MKFEKKTRWFIAALLAVALVFAGCSSGSDDDDDDSSSDPLSGSTYKPTKMVSVEDEGIFTMYLSGSTVKVTGVGERTTIISATKSGSTYAVTGTNNGEEIDEENLKMAIKDICDLSQAPATLEDAGQALYEFVSENMSLLVSFNDGIITFSDDDYEKGTYSVSGNSVTVTAHGHTGTFTTSDNWQTFSDEDGSTWAKQ